MVENKSIGSRITTIIIYVVLGVLTLSCLFPLWYTLCLSLSSKNAVDAGQIVAWPIGWNLKNYGEIVNDSVFFHSVGVSILRVALGTPITLITILLVAYPISKKKTEFYGRPIVIFILMLCMLFNGGLIPWYIYMVKFGMINNIWGLIFAGGLPVYYVLLTMNYFRSLPKELEEAAEIDGANTWTLLLRVIIPCSVPIIATITLFVSVNYWNEYFNGLVLSTAKDHYPLLTYIKSLVITITATSSTEEMIRAASISNRALNAAKVFVALIPMIIVYPFVQKYFIQGIMIGAVKE